MVSAGCSRCPAPAYARPAPAAARSGPRPPRQIPRGPQAPAVTGCLFLPLPQSSRGSCCPAAPWRSALARTRRRTALTGALPGTARRCRRMATRCIQGSLGLGMATAASPGPRSVNGRARRARSRIRTSGAVEKGGRRAGRPRGSAAPVTGCLIMSAGPRFAASGVSGPTAPIRHDPSAWPPASPIQGCWSDRDGHRSKPGLRLDPANRGGGSGRGRSAGDHRARGSRHGAGHGGSPPADRRRHRNR
jgi:hypothetical protein